MRGISRREFVGGSLCLLGTGLQPACDLDRIATPYKLGKYVLSPSGLEGAYDKISVDCPFVFRHEGSYYMTFVAFDGTGYQTGLASSVDLMDWKKEGCILERDPASPILKYNVAMNWILRENGLYSSGELTKVDGGFVGVYHAYPGQGYEQGAAVIGLCRSKDLRAWTPEAPCLLPQDGAEWEHGGLYKPCLVRLEGTYYIFYNAKNQTAGPWHEQTGVAMSRDLKTWKRYEGNPVIRNGGPGAPDEHFASDPCVLEDRGKWILFYFGLDRKGVARELAAEGADLLHYTKCDKILIDVGPKGSLDSAYAHKPSLIAKDGALYHYYCAVSHDTKPEVRGISVARSKPWDSGV